MASDIYRAVDPIADWSGPVRDSIDQARGDATRRRESVQAQGGISRPIVARRTDTGRCETADGDPIWPSHGKGSGAFRWR